MLGTIINTTAILAGATFGCLVRTGISDKYKTALFDALGLCCLVLGTNAALTNLPHSQCPVLFILSLAIGSVIGIRLNLSGRISGISGGREGASPLLTAVLLFCIGTFSIVGPVLSCLSPSHGWSFSEPGNTYLYTNATLDLVTSAVLAASYGRVILWAAPILFCWQGTFYAITYFCGAGMPQPMQTEICIVGGVLILSSGLSILGIKDCKTINLLPGLLIPVIYYLFQ